jgi:glycosyltransferase involved in cell wall biosynthesis
MILPEMTTAIVIPAYNEEATIAAVIRGVRELGTVIVVDDGSRDRTVSIARAEGAAVVVHEKNQGYDGALRSGFLKALELDCSYIITIDADGQHPPDRVEHFLKQLKDGPYDMVLGVRPKAARLAEHIFRYYVLWRYGAGDILCGLKAYRADSVRRHIDVTRMESVGTALALSILKDKGRFSEIPVHIRARRDKARIGGMIRANLLIFRCMLRVVAL